MNERSSETGRENPLNSRRGPQRTFASEAEREAAEESERKAEKEMFDKMYSPLVKSRLAKLRQGMKQSLIFMGFAFIIYITVVLILATTRTGFSFFNGAMIIYASVYFIAFLIYFLITRLQD